MSTAGDVIQNFNALPEEEKTQAAGAIAASRPLPNPPPRYVGVIWLMVVGAFIVLLLGGAFLMYRMVQDKESTAVVGPLVTGALGVLAGLLAPSPVGGSGQQ
jgi:hypothetical protein